MFETRLDYARLALARSIKGLEYQKNPVLWMKEKFNQPIESFQWSVYPEYAKHKWDGTPDPFLLAINSIAEGKDVGIEAATGVGKTYIAARVAYWFLDVFPGSAVITTAPTREQLLQVLWKEIGMAFPFFKRIRMNSTILTGEVRVNQLIKYSDDTVSIQYSNRMTSKVGRKRSGEDSSVAFQGIHNKYQLFILDECAGLEMSAINAIKNTNTDKSEGSINCILGLGNPDSQLDALHQFSDLESTVAIRISAKDHPNIVAGQSIPGAVTQGSIDLRAEEYGLESFFYKSRVRGIAPKQGSDALIHYDWIDSCFEDSKIFHGNEIDIKRDNAVGVDVANSEHGDMACLVWGRNNKMDEIHEFQCPDATMLAYNILLDNRDLVKHNFTSYNTSKIHDYEIRPYAVGVDGVGVGAATVGTMHTNVIKRVKCVSLIGGQMEEVINLDKEGKPLFLFNNLRSQMFWALREDFRLGKIILSKNIPKRMRNGLIKECTQVKYSVRGGRICIEGKEELKKRLGGKSPNVLDASAYWNWVGKGYYRGPRMLPFR